MASPQGLTREEARTLCANAVLRNGSYDPANAANLARLDFAIDAAFNEFCNAVKCDIQNDRTLTLAAGDDTLDCSGISTFEPTLFVDAFLLADGGPSDGVPVNVRFSDYKDALMARKGVYYPSNWVPGLLPPFVRADGQESVLAGWGPDDENIQFAQVFAQDMKLSLTWFLPFNRAAAGTGTRFNVPRQFCDSICYWGVPLYFDMMQVMQAGQTNPLTHLRKQFDQFKNQCRFPLMNKALQIRPPL